MTPRPDIAPCSVKAKSCTHHAHCLRAQLPPHPTRQAWTTPNRRGDECDLFIPAVAYTPVGSEAVQETQPLAEAGGVQFGAGRSSGSATTTSTGHAAGSTHQPALSTLPGAQLESAGLGVVHRETAGVGRNSAPAYLTQCEREQLHAARLLFPSARGAESHAA